MGLRVKAHEYDLQALGVVLYFPNGDLRRTLLRHALVLELLVLLLVLDVRALARHRRGVPRRDGHPAAGAGRCLQLAAHPAARDRTPRGAPQPGRDRPDRAAGELLAQVDEGLLLALDIDYDLIILNLANPDMVGHTGVVEAGIKAVETVDACCSRIIPKLLSLGGKALVTADHGNCELMRNPDGSPNTAHTTNLVHFTYVAEDSCRFRVNDGILADVAPTLLFLLALDKPVEMSGQNLLVSKDLPQVTRTVERELVSR